MPLLGHTLPAPGRVVRQVRRDAARDHQESQLPAGERSMTIRHSVTLSLSDDELIEVSQLLKRSRADAEVKASNPTLTKGELTLADTGRTIDAIRSVRDRLKCSLNAAKDIVEECRSR
jgi:ribosomal protein L7/L12